MSQEHQDDLVETAQRYLPGGSTWMWTLPRDLTFVVDRAEGSQVMDTIPGAKMYISLAHTDADIERTLEVFDAALTAL